MKEILVLYYSHTGAVREMAQFVARGVDGVAGCAARVRTVPRVTVAGQPPAATPEATAPHAELKDLEECIGIAVGSPTRFGNMAAPMKYFWDGTGELWLKGRLAGKPAAVFTSTATLHGGQETTLLSMMLPLLHHGMVMVGLPYTERALNETQRGGTPYGPTHVSGGAAQGVLTADEKELAQALGRRVASLAVRLQSK